MVETYTQAALEWIGLMKLSGGVNVVANIYVLALDKLFDSDKRGAK